MLNYCNNRYNIIFLPKRNSMKGRPKQYEEHELVERAMKVFWEKGYNASSAKDLMEAMDIGQGSFYLNFKGGKKELYQKTLKRFWKISKKQLKDGAENSNNPVLFIKGFFYSIMNRSRQEAANGCYLGNSIVEFRNLDVEMRKLASNLMSQFEKEFENILIFAQQNKNLGKEKSPSVIAKCLINLWNGVNITQRVGYNTQQLEDMIKTNLSILD